MPILIFGLQPLPLEELRGMELGPTGFKGLYPGIAMRSSGPVQREAHPSETFPILIAIQCMDGGRYLSKFDDGELPKTDYPKLWQASANRWMDFETTGF
jgi:hypothetical protein